MIATVSLTKGRPGRKRRGALRRAPNTGGIIGLGAALEYVSALGLTHREYEQTLMRYALAGAAAVPDLNPLRPCERLGVIAFNLGAHHAYDVGSFLDNYGIAMRTGHHCAMPLMAFTTYRPCVGLRWRCTIPRKRWTAWWQDCSGSTLLG
jgi:cysteine desulfurase/selenocysteine lyase